MLSNDFVADRLRPNVCKIVLALDSADSQPVRFDFMLQPQMRHIDVFHFSYSMSVKGVLCCFCVNVQAFVFMLVHDDPCAQRQNKGSGSR